MTSRSKYSFYLFCISLAFCFHTLKTYGQGKNFSISRNTPSWLVGIDQKGDKPSEKDINDGYYAALIEKQNHAELQESYMHVIRQIVSDAGVQNGSEISVTYDPSYEKLIFHRITVWRNGKPSDRLNASKFKVLQNEKDLSRFIYSGTYDAYMILDDIRKGDRIEYAYTIKGANPVFGNKYTETFYLENSSSIGHIYTNLIAGKSRKFHFKNFNQSANVKTTEKDGLNLYEWESRRTSTHRNTDFEPSWYNPFKYTQVSEYQNWAEVVDWGMKTNSYAGLKTPLVDSKIKELQQKAKNQPEQYIQLAIRFVQDEIRYMGVEMGVYSQRPNSPEKVLQQRYGDCKDKSLLLTYLLNKANINAYMAYIDTYSGKKLDEFLPSPTLFNHVVAVIERNGNKTWIDPTISYQRGAYDSIYFPNYGQALILKPGVTKPESVISIATGKLVADVTFDLADTSGKKPTILTIKSKYTDNYADNIRADIADQGIDGIQKSFLEYITKYYPDAESTRTVEIRDDEETNTLNITECYKIENFWKEDETDNDQYVYFYGDLIYSELRNIKAKSRIEPVAQKYPVNIEENVFINLPKSWNIKEETQRVETDNYYFEFNSFIRGSQLRLNYSYRSLKDHLEGKDIKQYVKDTKKIKDNLPYFLSWGRTTAQTTTADSNSYLLLLSIIVVIGTCFFFMKVYQKPSEFDLEELAQARSFGSWIVITAIILPLACIGVIGEGVASNAYSTASWEALKWLKSFYKIGIGAFYIVQAIAYALKFNFLLFLTFLFYNRRTTFPAYYVLFLKCMIGFNLFKFAGNCLINSANGQEITDVKTVIIILISITSAVLWILYYQRSVRVKETFVFTYPEFLWRKELIQYKNSQMSAYFSRQNQINQHQAPGGNTHNHNDNSKPEVPDPVNTPDHEDL